MQQAQPVVIVDRNGTEHEFPPGFDPKKAGEIVRKQLDAGGAQPTQPPSAPPQDAPRHPMGEFGKGVAKGAMRTIGNVASYASMMFPGINYTPADQARVERDTAPEGAGQRLGYVAESVAEMAIPLGQAGNAARKVIPTTAKAGETFQRVMAAAKDVPLDVSEPGEVALRIYQLSERGGSMPKAVRDFLKRTTDPEKGPLTYAEARDFASNISRLSVNEFGRLTPAIAREIHKLRITLNKAVGQAAAKAGKGDDYAAAMNEYARAKRIQDAWEATKKWAIPVGATAGAGAYVNKLLRGGG